MNEKDLNKIIKGFEKEFGEGTLMNFDNTKNLKVNCLKSGSLILDRALGINGFPEGRIVEVYGPESSGKTSLTLHTILEAQRKGGTAAFIDAEHAFDPTFAQKIGIDLKKLIVSQPNSGDQALDIVDKLVKTNLFSLIVIDSVAALVPQAELSGSISDQSIGLQARLMSKSLRMLSGTISKSKTIVIFINQIREKVGVIFGSPETTPGGRSLKFFSSIRVDLRIRERLYDDSKNLIGQRIKFKIVKNKLAVPYKILETNFYYDKGFNNSEEKFELMIMDNEITKKGSWYYYKDEKLGQGKKEALKYMINKKII